MPELDEVALAVLDGLAASGVPYALAGGLSANAWLAPHQQAPTFDVDAAIFVPEGVSLAAEDLATDFGRRLGADCLHSATRTFPRTTIERFLCGDVVIDLVLAPSDYARVAMDRAGTTQVRGVTHRVLDPDDVILYKALARRQKDVPVIRALAEVQPVRHRYIESWARSLRVWGYVRKALGL